MDIAKVFFCNTAILVYYEARYYDPKTSVWLSVDPLAVYNPLMETEFCGDGQYNGGVYNSGNLIHIFILIRILLFMLIPMGSRFILCMTGNHNANTYFKGDFKK